MIDLEPTTKEEEEKMSKLFKEEPISKEKIDDTDKFELIEEEPEEIQKKKTTKKKSVDLKQNKRNTSKSSRNNGENSKSKGGLWDYEIESMMKGVPNFQGCIAADQVEKLPPNKYMSFIMNLSPTNKSGSHWVACHMDTNNEKEIDYYDSFGREPSKDFVKQIHTLVKKIKPNTYLKFKSNKVVDQRANSDTCGWHCIKFILDREHGVPFKETTGYSNVKKGEEEVKKLKEKFGFI